VTFRYKPLLTSLGADQPKIRSTYANNKGKFSLGINLTQSIQDFANIIDREDEQVYDTILSVANLRSAITANRYSEVIYPREMLTGLAETRGRTNYSEVADGTEVLSGSQVVFISASLSIGSNGIDRGPLERRTFWRDDPAFRNRRLNQYITIEDKSSTIYAYPPLNVPYITGALPNSQGYKSGFATGINGFGETPIAFRLATTASTSYALFGLSGADDIGLTLADYPDTGELNSPNDQTIAGYFGVSPFSDPNQTGVSSSVDLPFYSTFQPTASCYYYHQQMLTFPRISSSLGLKWRVSELSGKNPWFDSYEDYAQDIRAVAKNYTILPEFRISKHMEYYIDREFKSPQNDQFLTLDGASVTSSALTPRRGDGIRGFNESFFNEYSNSDFQKYFGKFGYTDDFGGKIRRITLKCNAVKKLLPYHGFYPSHRSLQVASLFSQSIAPHIGGIKWKAGATTEPSNIYPSGALAVQSLLQPFYAPGIMYNTIKSGIACDWAAYTGSAEIAGAFTNGYLDKSPNYRIPFETIINPLGGVGIPASSSTGDQKINLIYPSYSAFNAGSPPTLSWADAINEIRAPYFDLDDLERQKAAGSTKYEEYRRAINNYLAEIPNFFLANNSLKEIKSRRAGQVSLTSGKRYYMDIYLEKDPNLVMIEDYNNGHRGSDASSALANAKMTNHPLTSDTEYKSLNGRFFGPPVKAGTPNVSTTDSSWGLFTTKMGDPAYAPY
jgi:predicted DNA-binding protein